MQGQGPALELRRKYFRFLERHISDRFEKKIDLFLSSLSFFLVYSIFLIEKLDPEQEGKRIDMVFVSTARCSRRSNGLGYIPSHPSHPSGDSFDSSK